MWKWIGGILLVIVLCLAGAIWAGYRKLTSGGDAATVTIAASPDRVFAAFANHDSLANWWILDGSPAPMGRGPLAAGDSLPAQTRRSEARQRLSPWTIDQVVPGKLLVLSLRGESAGLIVAVRRDSLLARGDSTQIVSTISSPMMANVQSGDTGQTSRGASSLIGMSSKLLVSAMRIQSQMQLTHLKSHVEGRPVEGVHP